MNLNCRFSSCQWSGNQDEIFDHLESVHKKFLREPMGNLYFDLTFDDLQQEAFVLCSPTGLYWFRQNLHQPRSNGIDFGVFHIGGSEAVSYELKLGLKRDDHCEYWGPYTSEQDTIQDSNKEADGYNLKFDFEYLEVINETMPSRRLRLYFGEYDDSDDKLWPTPQDIEWQENDELANRLCVEHFTCPVCFYYIRRDARFCENNHCVCLKCFDKIQEKNLCCPTCRGQYLYDCMDNDVERLLRMVKWPDMPEIEEDKELQEFVKSIQNVKVIKVKAGEND